MKFRIIFIDNRVTLIFLADTVASSIDPIELTPADNTLEPIKRHLAGRDFKLTADASQCSLKLVDSNAFRASFEITANPDNSDPKTKIIAFLKILIHDLKDAKLLTEDEFNEINNKIGVEIAKDFCEKVPSDAFVEKKDDKGKDIVFIKDRMEELVGEAGRDTTTRGRLQTILSDLKTCMDDYETQCTKSKSFNGNGHPSPQQEVKGETVSVSELLADIREKLTGIKKFIREQKPVSHIYSADDAYEFLDQIGPKNCSGPPDFTPLDQTIPTRQDYELAPMSANGLKEKTIEVKRVEKGIQYRVIGLDQQIKTGIIEWKDLPKNFPKSDQQILSNKNKLLLPILTETSKAGHTLLRSLTRKLEEVKDLSGKEKINHLRTTVALTEAYKNDPVLLAAFNACIELLLLYDKLFARVENEILKKNDKVEFLKCPATQLLTQNDFEVVKRWALNLYENGDIRNLKRKSAEQLQASKETHSNAALVTKPVVIAPAKKAPKEDSTTPLLAGEKPALSESDKPSFAKRHPWVVKLAKAGAFIFGTLAFVSFFVPVPGLNLTLAGVFSAISAACGTVAAGIAAGTAAVVAITGGTVAVGAGVGAASGKLLECTPCCNPSNNAKMHKYLGFSVNSDNNLGPYVSLPPSTEYEEEESTAAYSPMPDRPMPAEEKRSAHLGATVKRL